MPSSSDPLYERMVKDGVCSYGASFDEWQMTWRERSLVNPPALLAALDFEWMQPDEIAEWAPPGYWAEEHVFVPFAHSGGGDLYAFYPRWGSAVVYAAHDANDCTALAPHLEGLLYRLMLEAMTYDDGERWDDLGPDEVDRFLAANIRVLKPYLRAAWFDDLEAVRKAKPREWALKLPAIEERYLSRLDHQGLQERLARELKFAHLDEKFEHMKR
jgi:hypothetical protein